MCIGIQQIISRSSLHSLQGLTSIDQRNLERQLCSLVFLTRYNRDDQARLQKPDGPVLYFREMELSDKTSYKSL